MDYRMLDTICIRTDMTIERIAYHPALFFQGQDVSMDNALGVRELFEQETGIPCDALVTRSGAENVLAEELFYRSFQKNWSIHGDCVLALGRSMTPKEMRIIEEFLLELKEAVIHREDRKQLLTQAYYERIYDKTKSNTLIIAPDRRLVPIALSKDDMEQEILRYFTVACEDAYPYAVESENVDLLNESLKGQFRIRIYYDKMGSYVGEQYNDFGMWLTKEDEVCGDLMIVGEEPMTMEQLAVMMKLMDALMKRYSECEAALN